MGAFGLMGGEYEQVVYNHDAASGLKAIIAIHELESSHWMTSWTCTQRDRRPGASCPAGVARRWATYATSLQAGRAGRWPPAPTTAVRSGDEPSVSVLPYPIKRRAVLRI